MRHLIYIILVVFSAFVITLWTQIDTKVTIPAKSKITTNTPKCIQTFYAIEKYSQEFDIPKDYAYGIAWSETRYAGPFHWEYDPCRTSSANALGPMQVMYSTAKMLYPEEKFTPEYLRDNIDFNVKCSMKLIRHLYATYGDWETVFGAYNTGKPIINGYSQYVVNYDFKRNLKQLN